MSKFNATCKQNQQRLLEYLEDENLSAFTDMLQNKDINNIDPNHENGDPYYKTCLVIASQKGLVEFMEALLANGADPNLICRHRNGNAPIHFAAEKGHLDAIKCLVRHHVNLSVINKRGETALHVSARHLAKTISDKAEECFSYLANQTDMSLSHRNTQGQSAISEVVGKCSEDTLQKVLQCCDLRPEDRKLILEKYPKLKVDAREITEPPYTHDDAYMDLRNGNIDRFKKNFKKEFANKTDLIETTFLQLACKEGLLDVVEFLLSYEADINKSGTQERKPPIYLACYHGQYDILKYLSTESNINVKLVEEKTLLHTVLEGVRDRRAAPDSYHECFDYLLQENEMLNIPINHRDSCGHTALHYAVQEDDDYFAEALLVHGAYVGSLNDFGFCPLNDMDSETLERALDKCVECSRGNESNKYTLKFNFNILKPTAICDESKRPKDVEPGELPQERLPEMFPLYFISQSKKLGHLLKHPVLLIFLHLKWNRINVLFYLNMIFYIIFVIFLTADILSDSSMCCECSRDSEPKWIRVILVVLSVVLVFRELMQFCMLPEKCSYFYNLENWLEIGIIVTTVLILVGSCSKILAAVTLLLAWTEIILQFGCIYTLAIYSEMMKTVTLNYMKFLLWYSPLIIAFTFSFYKLYHSEASSKENDSSYMVHNMSSNFSTHDDDGGFYSNLSMSLLKTVIMMIGEFDASNMSFNHGGYFVFLFFIFMMTVVLINLLNGLAVSDTQAIKDNAELVTYRSKVQLVHHFESVVFGGSRNGQGGSGYKLIGRTLSLWCPWQWRLQRTISLFPDILPDGSLCIILHQGTRYEGTKLKKEDVEFRPDTCCTIRRYRIGFHLDREVLEAAKDIADRTAKESEQKKNQILNRIARIEEDIQGCKKKLVTMEELLKHLITNT
jgi:ankyrin repeat protein